MAIVKSILSQQNAPVMQETSGLHKDILDSLDLTEAPVIPDSAPTVRETAFQEAPEVTLEEAEQLEQRQMDLEAESALQDRFGTRPVAMGPSDVQNIFGEEATPRIIEGIKRLGRTDSVIVPFNEAKKLAVMDNFNGNDTASAPEKEEGVIDTDNYIDSAKTKKLTQADLFVHMDGVRLTDDSRTLEVLPDLQILALALTEANYANEAAEASVAPKGMMETLGREEVEKLVGFDELGAESKVTEPALGRLINEEWLKMKQRAAEGPDARMDAHNNPENELTPEAYLQLGVWAKQSYAVAMPHMLTVDKVKTKNGLVRNDYKLTTEGAKILESSKQDLLPPKVFARPQVTADPKATTKHSKTKDSTGYHYSDPKTKGKLTNEDEARQNLASVRHVVTKVRLKAGMLMSLVGLGASAQVRQDPQGNLKVGSNAAEMLGIGQKAADKINSASTNALLRVEGLQVELNDLKLGDVRAEGLREKIEILKEFAIQSADAGWKMRMYRRQSTKALEMLQDIAEFSDDPISFTNYIQKGTSRIGYSAQKMNMQTHKLARQLYGSATKYVVKPGSNSNAEYAMLVTMGSQLFAEGNTVPEKTYSDMRQRIMTGDQKTLAIAAVGRKLKGILEGYNEEATVSAILNMDMAENQVNGVGDVMNTLGNLQLDEDVKRFLDEAFTHPNEVLNLIEGAIELGNYMDAVASGGTFMSTMRPVEVDGISNGLASMTAQLGLQNVMYRVGVLRQDPNKVLAEFEGIEGNIRKELAKNMRSSLADVMSTPEFRKEFGTDHTNFDQISAFLEAAIQNESAFLKPPIMTLPYGQAVKSMGSTMLSAVTTSKELTALAEGTEWGSLGVSKMLHRILAHNLEITLGAEVTEFSEALKDVTEVAMIADEAIKFRKPSGVMTSSNSFDYAPTGAKDITGRINENWDDSSGKRKSKEIALQGFTPSKKTLSALGSKTQGGSAMKTGILPQAIIGFDGATMVNTLSGASYKAIQGASGQQTPYVTAIYDAVIGDLGSFRSLVSNINKTWIDTTLNYDLLNELTKGVREAQSDGYKKLQKNAAENPYAPVQNVEHSKHLYTEILKYFNANADTGVVTPDTINQFGNIMRTAERNFTNLASNKDISSSDKYKMSSALNLITNEDLLHMFIILKPAMDIKVARLQQVANQAKTRRQVLKKELGGQPVFQYHVDALKQFNFN